MKAGGSFADSDGVLFVREISGAFTNGPWTDLRAIVVSCPGFREYVCVVGADMDTECGRVELRWLEASAKKSSASSFLAILFPSSRKSKPSLGVVRVTVGDAAEAWVDWLDTILLPPSKLCGLWLGAL